MNRYRPSHPAERDPTSPPPPEFHENKGTWSHFIKPAEAANPKSLKVVKILLLITTAFTIMTSCCIIYIEEPMYKLVALIPCTLFIVATVMVNRQPRDDSFRSFKMPLVPSLPLLSAFINVYLMLELSYVTWIRFVVWQSVGFLIYFSYGMWHSSERHREFNTETETETRNGTETSTPAANTVTVAAV